MPPDFADLQVHQRALPQGASPEEEPAQGDLDSPLPQVSILSIRSYFVILRANQWNVELVACISDILGRGPAVMDRDRSNKPRGRTRTEVFERPGTVVLKSRMNPQK